MPKLIQCLCFAFAFGLAIASTFTVRGAAALKSADYSVQDIHRALWLDQYIRVTYRHPKLMVLHRAALWASQAALEDVDRLDERNLIPDLLRRIPDISVSMGDFSVSLTGVAVLASEIIADWRADNAEERLKDLAVRSPTLLPDLAAELYDALTAAGSENGEHQVALRNLYEQTQVQVPEFLDWRASLWELAQQHPNLDNFVWRTNLRARTDEQVAQALGAALANRQFFGIEPENDREVISQQLESLEQLMSEWHESKIRNDSAAFMAEIVALRAEFASFAALLATRLPEESHAVQSAGDHALAAWAEMSLDPHPGAERVNRDRRIVENLKEMLQAVMDVEDQNPEIGEVLRDSILARWLPNLGERLQRRASWSSDPFLRDTENSLRVGLSASKADVASIVAKLDDIQRTVELGIVGTNLAFQALLEYFPEDEYEKKRSWMRDPKKRLLKQAVIDGAMGKNTGDLALYAEYVDTMSQVARFGTDVIGRRPFKPDWQFDATGIRLYGLSTQVDFDVRFSVLSDMTEWANGYLGLFDARAKAISEYRKWPADPNRPRLVRGPYGNLVIPTYWSQSLAWYLNLALALPGDPETKSDDNLKKFCKVGRRLARATRELRADTPIYFELYLEIADRSSFLLKEALGQAVLPEKLAMEDRGVTGLFNTYFTDDNEAYGALQALIRPADELSQEAQDRLAEDIGHKWLSPKSIPWTSFDRARELQTTIDPIRSRIAERARRLMRSDLPLTFHNQVWDDRKTISNWLDALTEAQFALETAIRLGFQYCRQDFVPFLSAFVRTEGAWRSSISGEEIKAVLDRADPQSFLAGLYEVLKRLDMVSSAAPTERRDSRLQIMLGFYRDSPWTVSEDEASKMCQPVPGSLAAGLRLLDRIGAAYSDLLPDGCPVE